MMIGPDITSVLHYAVRKHLSHPQPDAVLNIETHLFNVTLIAETCVFKLNVGKELWLNRSRWSRLVKEYVPKEPLDRFVDQAVEILNGEARLGATANMMFRDPDRYDKKHRWGGCLMGAVFRGDNKKSGPATLTFHSRTTYMGYMGMLDACIANCVARAIIKRHAPGDYEAAGDYHTMKLGVPMQFRWHIGSMQLHCFKTLPFMFSQPDLFARLKNYSNTDPKYYTQDVPTWKHTVTWYNKILEHWATSKNNVGKFLESEKYGPFRRIKRRWCEHMGYLDKHIPPDLFPVELDFDKAV